MQDTVLKLPSLYMVAALFLGSFMPLPVFSVVRPKVTPFLRLEGEASRLKVNKKGRGVAFTDPRGFNLSYLDLQTKKIYRISRHKVGSSFFWSPDGFRIFFRELVTSDLEKSKVISVVKVFDTHQAKSIEIERVPGLSGDLTFDPRDLRFQLMHSNGIIQRRISFPGERLAKWQLAQSTQDGRYVVSAKAILWLTHSGFSMRKLKDDGSGLSSFDISPDGSSIVWATKKSEIFLSVDGSNAVNLASGLDPKWHPVKPIFVFSGVRKIGGKIVSYDLKLANGHGKITSLTSTGGAGERWPIWVDSGKAVVFAMIKTTDLYYLRIL